MNKEQITEAINKSYMAIKENKICLKCNHHERHPSYELHFYCRKLHIKVRKKFGCHYFQK